MIRDTFCKSGQNMLKYDHDMHAFGRWNTAAHIIIAATMIWALSNSRFDNFIVLGIRSYGYYDDDMALNTLR